MGNTNRGFFAGLGMEELREDLEGNEELAPVEEATSKEVDRIGDDIEVAVDDMESLSNLKTALESFATVPEDAAYFARMAVRRVERRYGLRAGAIASMESFDKDGFAISMEGLGETLKKFWEMIKEKLAKMMEATKKFFENFFNYFRRKKAKLEETEEKIKGEKQSENASQSHGAKIKVPGKAVFKRSHQLSDMGISKAVGDFYSFSLKYDEVIKNSFTELLKELEENAEKKLVDIYDAYYRHIEKIMKELPLPDSVTRGSMHGKMGHFITGFEPVFTIPSQKSSEPDKNDTPPITCYKYEDNPDKEKLPEMVEIRPIIGMPALTLLAWLKKMNDFFANKSLGLGFQRGMEIDKFVRSSMQKNDEHAANRQKIAQLALRHSRSLNDIEHQMYLTARYLIETYDKILNQAMDTAES